MIITVKTIPKKNKSFNLFSFSSIHIDNLHLFIDSLIQFECEYRCQCEWMSIMEKNCEGLQNKMRAFKYWNGTQYSFF